jgi:hypothetical protein
MPLKSKGEAAAKVSKKVAQELWVGLCISIVLVEINVVRPCEATTDIVRQQSSRSFAATLLVSISGFALLVHRFGNWLFDRQTVHRFPLGWRRNHHRVHINHFLRSLCPQRPPAEGLTTTGLLKVQNILLASRVVETTDGPCAEGADVTRKCLRTWFQMAPQAGAVVLAKQGSGASG